MVSRINAKFPRCTTLGCIKVDSKKKLWVVDVSGKSDFYSGEEKDLTPPFFTVNNNNSKDIHLLCIDDCIFKASDGKKCDFAVFHDSVFCFVEIKRGLCTPDLLKEKKEDAANQLRVTINAFLSQNVDFAGYTKEACICVGFKKASPRARAKNQDLTKEFWDDFRVELYEGSEIDFH